MGGTIEMVNSALSLVNNLTGQGQTNKASSQYEQLKAEREAQAEELRQQEAEERKQARDRITEAREKERRKEAQTTLTSGGLLVESEPETVPLKDKFGE